MTDKIRQNIRDSWLKRFPTSKNKSAPQEELSSSSLQQPPHKKQKIVDFVKELSNNQQKLPLETTNSNSQKIVISLLDSDDENDNSNTSNELEEIHMNGKNTSENKYEKPKIMKEVVIEDATIENSNHIDEVIQSPIQVIHSPILPQKDTTKLSSLFTKDVIETYQFSMQLDVDFLIDIIMKNCSNPKTIHIIAHDIINYENYMKSPLYSTKINSWTHQGISKFSTGSLHHSKMMINFYDKGSKGLFCEVIVLTCNLTAVEVAYMGACLWRSSLLPLKSSEGSDLAENRESSFESNLKYYLSQYRNNESKNLIAKISQYDFSSVKADFVGAFPRSRNDPIPCENKVGFTFLKSVINKYHPPNSHMINRKPLKILSQVSSFAGPCNKAPLKNIFTHILCPIFANVDYPSTTHFGDKYDPIVVFPTSKDITNGKGGPEVQGQYIFSAAGPGDEQYDILMKDYFYKIDFQNEMKTHLPGYQNSFVNNHSKIYCVSDNYDVIENAKVRFNSIKCVFMGSFNLSKSAWGTPNRKYEASCRNWECGILIHEAMYNDNYSNKNIELVPVWNRNTAGSSFTDQTRIPIRLPFMFPVVKTKYGEPFYRKQRKW